MKKTKHFENAFQVKEIYENTFCITDNAMSIVNMYLLIGDEKALLIDSGYGNPKLKKVVESITDKEVICVCTHGHLDHAMGAYLFSKSYMHSADKQVFLNHSAPEFFRFCGYEGIGAKPKKRLKMSGYTENVKQLMHIERPVPENLETQKRFELGNREVTWTLIAGHTPGSVAFLDKKNHVIFDGDAAVIGTWMFLPESLDLDLYCTNLKHYRDFLSENQITKRFGGHILKALSIQDADNLLKTCRTICEKEKNGKKSGIAINMPIGQCRIVIKNKTLIYIKDTVKGDPS